MRCTLILAGLLLTAPVLADEPAKPILIGVEYAYPGGGKTFAQLGVPAAKLYPDSITWGEMQAGPGQPIDFSKMDRFVREYHAAGFTDLVLVLKSHSRWASINYLRNPAPRPQFLADYEAWVRAVVERYDFDGKDDMPGLRRPVRFFEIGSEFSKFEPELAEDYVIMLDRAYRAAHSASDRAVVLHAAFLTPTVFRDRPKPDKLAAEFDRVNRRIFNHGLDGMRKVLDSRNFDAINFHALTNPEEIEPTVAWLRTEMKARNLNKPIVITDTTPNPLVAWGPATKLPPPEIPGVPPRSNTTGIVVLPATEADRPALVDYFNRLLDGDREATSWTHAFVAADMVKKVVIAAEQGVELINTSFMEDLALFKSRVAQAGAGVSAWAGMADTEINLQTEQRTIKSLRPSFYAIQQLQKHLRNYDSIERVKNNNAKVRLYKFTKGDEVFWIAWHDTSKLYLPGMKVPSVKYAMEVEGQSLTIEKMIDKPNQKTAETSTAPIKNGVAELTLTVRPVFLFKK